MAEPHESFPRHARARVGSTLNAKYRLDRLVGVGGMASVYEATHRNGSRVAVKLLHGPLSVDADIRSRFLREGYVANKVGHHGAVRVIDDDEAEDGSAFLVMELLLGSSLDVRWERSGRKVAAKEVMAIAYQLLDVLAAAHENGIVHRDIKPANLFLTTVGVVKVLDFGIARLLDTPRGHASTHTGRAVGTPAFMPPEQALGRTRDIDGQTDLWAVGATMFTMLTGKDVHEAETAGEQLVFAATKSARSLGSVAPDLPPELVALVDRAVAFDKARRWSSARAMRDALRTAYEAAFSEPLESALPLLAAPLDSLGAVRSNSPRAFAPTVQSDHSGLAPKSGRPEGLASLGAPTEPATELSKSQLGGGQRTTAGGALSVSDRPASTGAPSTFSRRAERRRSLGIVAAAAAVILGVSVWGLRTQRAGVLGASPPLVETNSSTEGLAATAIPVGLAPAQAPGTAATDTPLADPTPTPIPVAAPASSVGTSSSKAKGTTGGRRAGAPPAAAPSASAPAAAPEHGGIIDKPQF